MLFVFLQINGNHGNEQFLHAHFVIFLFLYISVS